MSRGVFTSCSSSIFHAYDLGFFFFILTSNKELPTDPVLSLKWQTSLAFSLFEATNDFHPPIMWMRFRVWWERFTSNSSPFLFRRVAAFGFSKSPAAATNALGIFCIYIIKCMSILNSRRMQLQKMKNLNRIICIYLHTR